MEEEDVEPQGFEQDFEQPEAVEQTIDETEQAPAYESKTQVPLSALQKERKKRQELEMQLEYERSRYQKPAEPPVEDNSRYESATREDLNNSQAEAVRIIEERLWVKQNPEKHEKLNEYLPTFLKQRPNLASAINSASNRYEEAYTLMEALTPREQKQLKQESIPKKVAPNAPTNVPKAAAMNQAVDVMSMSDQEFAHWRKAQKRRR